MKGCHWARKNLGALLTNELSPQEEKSLLHHLQECPSCAAELKEFQKIFEALDSWKEIIEKEEEKIDWSSFPWQTTRLIKAKAKKKQASKQDKWPGKLRLWFPRPLWVGLFLGVVIGALSMLFFRPQLIQRQKEEAPFNFPPSMLTQIEQNLAREETKDYLEKSQLIFLEFLQLPSDQAQRFWKDKLSSQEIQNLLLKKKYLNSQLDDLRMARVKAICDQIEFLIYELIRVSEGFSNEDVIQLQKFIQEKQLLLKINLIKKELEESEV